MLYGINSTVSTVQQTQFDIRKTLVKLAKKYRKLDRIIKSGMIDMEQNFIYYLNNGADIDELRFYWNHHDKETRNMLARFSNVDSKFNRKLRGRSIVLNEIAQVLNGEIN